MNERKEVNDFSKLTDEEWITLLVMLAYENAGHYWYDFQKEIKENNRFFPKAELLNIIRDMKDDAVCCLEKGDRFYRARLFHSFFLETHKKELKEFEEAIIKAHPGLKGKSFEEMSYIIDGQLAWQNEFLNDKLVSLLQRKKRYWGYNSKGSDAPPSKIATAGRANPAGISYLYICDSVETAIMEVRPAYGQNISVATIEITDNVKIFDFCKADGKFDNGGDAVLHGIISNAFSTPYYGDEKDYYPTQYLCEFIKELGFEGIKYYSSLDFKSKDIVIFNTVADGETKKKKYKINNSRVYVFNGYNPSIMQVAPWKKMD